MTVLPAAAAPHKHSSAIITQSAVRRAPRVAGVIVPAMELLELLVRQLGDDLRIAARVDGVVVVREQRRLDLLVVHAVRLTVHALQTQVQMM